MRSPRVGAALLACVAAALDLTAGPAAGATTEIGAVGEIHAMPPALPAAISSGGDTVEIAEAAGTYAVPPGYGTITAWSHSTGTASGALTFKVYRPTGALHEFFAIASDTRAVTANTVQAFPVAIPVRPGDRIGLSSDDPQAVQLAFQTDNPADQIGFFTPDPPVGTAQATDGDPFQGYKLDVAATLQSDPAATGGPPAGGPPSAGSAPTATPLPVATKPRVVPSAFAAAASGPSALAAARRPSALVAARRTQGAKVSYSLNIPATVLFTVQRRLPGRRTGTGPTARCVPETRRNRKAARCTRTVTLGGGFSRTAKAAANSFRFTGRLAGRKLKPGAYTLVATPAANGRSGSPVNTGFQVIR